MSGSTSDKGVIGKLGRRLLHAITRCVLRRIDDGRKMQTVQIVDEYGDVLDDLERWQPYGLSAHPRLDAEGMAVAPGGDQSHTIVIQVDDRRHRPRNIAEGEIVLYTDEDGYDPDGGADESDPAKPGQHRIHFKRSRKIEMVADELRITVGNCELLMQPNLMTITVPRLEIYKAS